MAKPSDVLNAYIADLKSRKAEVAQGLQDVVQFYANLSAKPAQQPLQNAADSSLSWGEAALQQLVGGNGNGGSAGGGGGGKPEQPAQPGGPTDAQLKDLADLVGGLVEAQRKQASMVVKSQVVADMLNRIVMAEAQATATAKATEQVKSDLIDLGWDL